MTNVPEKGLGLDAIHPIRNGKKTREKHTDSILQPDLNAFAHVLGALNRDVHTSHAKQADPHVEVRGMSARMLNPPLGGTVDRSNRPANSVSTKRPLTEKEHESQGLVDVLNDSSNHAAKQPLSTATLLPSDKTQKNVQRSTISTDELQGSSIVSRFTTATNASAQLLASIVPSRGRDLQTNISVALDVHRGPLAITGLDRSSPGDSEMQSAVQVTRSTVEGDQIPLRKHPAFFTMLTGPAPDGKAKLILDNEKNAWETHSPAKPRNVAEKGQVDGRSGEAFGPLNTHQIQGSGPIQGLQEPLTSIDTRRSTAYQELSNVISSNIRSGSHEITVHVQPEGMGNIVISVSKETAGLRVSITADHAQTLQWIENGKHEVMQALQSLGVDVASLQLNLSQSGAFHQSLANQSHQSRGHSQHPVSDEASRVNPSSDETGSSLVNASDFSRQDWRASTISVQV